MTQANLDINTCIVGGGPAGMLLGLLLARAGVDVLVLEKHADFLRDFRGDIVHSSTLMVLREMGLLDTFLSLPHQKLTELGGDIGKVHVKLADFSHLSVPFIVVMPQWDFLNFLAAEAKKYPNFHLRMSTEAITLIQENNKIVGVVAKHMEQTISIRSQLVVGADGRHSTVRAQADLPVIDFGAPIDVFWFRLSRDPSATEDTLGRIVPGKMMVTINRGDYWQCGYIIPKGGADVLQEQGLAAFREAIAAVAPSLGDKLNVLQDWEQIKLLTVKVDFLMHWFRPGLLCIGDAAHAMSPVGGVGINLAIQDAVATANLLAIPLRTRKLTTADLAKVQHRREWPVRMIQKLQIFLHKRVLSNVLSQTDTMEMQVPLPVRWLNRYRFLRRIPARLIAMGFRPEHVTIHNNHGVSSES